MSRVWILLLVPVLVGCSLVSTAAPASPVPSPSAAVPQQQARLVLPSPATGGQVTAEPAPTRQPTEPPATTPTLASLTSTPAANSTPVPTVQPSSTATPAPPAEVVYSLPMRLPGRPPGDGLFIRHGYAVENTWFNPGYWHAGEDWYLLDGDSGGASVYAVAAGDVVYVGSNYPGRVVIVQHPDGLYSMYGHLDPAVAVQPGQQVERGALLGTLLQRSDTVPDHLHFEIRTFYLQDAVNGATPRYGFPCGVNCPPGPGYWPISAPDHPSDMGWRNPLHVLANRAFAPAGAPAPFDLIVVAQPAAESLTLWSAPPAAAGEPAPEALATVPLQPGERFPLLDSWIGPEDSRETSALAYHIWYHIRLPDGRTGWVQAAVASSFETGSNGRPATIRFNMVPDL